MLPQLYKLDNINITGDEKTQAEKWSQLNNSQETNMSKKTSMSKINKWEKKILFGSFITLVQKHPFW